MKREGRQKKSHVSKGVKFIKRTGLATFSRKNSNGNQMPYYISHIITGALVSTLGFVVGLFFHRSGFILGILFPLVWATFRELEQNYQWIWPHHQQTLEQNINDVGHFMLGAAIPCIIFSLVKLFSVLIQNKSR